MLFPIVALCITSVVNVSTENNEKKDMTANSFVQSVRNIHDLNLPNVIFIIELQNKTMIYNVYIHHGRGPDSAQRMPPYIYFLVSPYNFSLLALKLRTCCIGSNKTINEP